MKLPSFEFGRAVGAQRGRGFMAAVGCAGLLLAGVTFYIGYEAAYSVPGRGYYDLQAEFVDANNLANHYEIRMGGVRAGQVLHPRVENGKALVDLRLEDQFKPLPVDSKLQVRLRSAVGVRYLEIIPGKSKQMLADGERIKADRTVPSVALDEVLGTFDKDTRARTQTLLRELGNGVNDRGIDINDAIRDAPGFLDDVASVSKTITDRPGRVMSGFIRNGNNAAGAFDDARQDIVDGFEPEQQALEIFTEARDSVGRTLDTAGPSLASLSRTLPTVDGLLRETAALARESRPTFRLAPASLKATTKVLDEADQPLDDLKDTLDLADSAVDPVLDVLGKLKPVLPTVESTVDHLKPQLAEMAPKACELQNVVRSWAQYLTIGNRETNFIRFHLLALRPEQTAGQQGKVLPELDNLWDSLVGKNQYYGPCTNDNSEGATGLQAPVTARVLNAGVKPFNNSDNKPWETDPNKVASPSQVIGGGE